MNRNDIIHKVHSSDIICLSSQLGKNNVNPDEAFNIMAYIWLNYLGHNTYTYTLFIRIEDLDYFCDTQVEYYCGYPYAYTNINGTRNYFYERYNDEDDNRTIAGEVQFDKISSVIIIDSSYNEVSEKDCPNITQCNYPAKGIISIKGIAEGTDKITTYNYHFTTHYLYLNSESFKIGYTPIKLPEDKQWTVISPNIIGNIIIGGECICGNVKDFLTYSQSAKNTGQKLFLSDEFALNLCIINDDKNYASKLNELKTNLYEAFEAEQALDIEIINFIDENGKIVYK